MRKAAPPGADTESRQPYDATKAAGPAAATAATTAGRQRRRRQWLQRRAASASSSAGSSCSPRRHELLCSTVGNRCGCIEGGACWAGGPAAAGSSGRLQPRQRRGSQRAAAGRQQQRRGDWGVWNEAAACVDRPRWDTLQLQRGLRVRHRKPGTASQAVCHTTGHRRLQPVAPQVLTPLR